MISKTLKWINVLWCSISILNKHCRAFRFLLHLCSKGHFWLTNHQPLSISWAAFPHFSWNSSSYLEFFSTSAQQHYSLSLAKRDSKPSRPKGLDSTWSLQGEAQMPTQGLQGLWLSAASKAPDSRHAFSSRNEWSHTLIPRRYSNARRYFPSLTIGDNH